MNGLVSKKSALPIGLSTLEILALERIHDQVEGRKETVYMHVTKTREECRQEIEWRKMK